MSVNRRLTRSRPVHCSDADLAAGIWRLIRALGHRLAEDDPGSVRLLRRLDRELEAAWATAIDGWRASGFSDTEIGAALGPSKQNVNQRWPRREEER